jgi:hypothetical protein
MNDEFKIIVDDDCWNSGLEDEIIKPIAKKAVDLHADKVVERGTFNCEVDGYSIRMHKNLILGMDFYKFIEPRAMNAKYMINVEVGVPSGENKRWFVGIYYKFDGKEWVDQDSLKELTTYEG